MPHLREIVQKRCACGKRAYVTLYNDRNAPVRDLCMPCGRRELKRLNPKKSPKP